MKPAKYFLILFVWSFLVAVLSVQLAHCQDEKFTFIQRTPSSPLTIQPRYNFEGLNASTTNGTYNAGMFSDLQTAVNVIPSGGSLLLPCGVSFTLSSTLTINKTMAVFQQCRGQAFNAGVNLEADLPRLIYNGTSGNAITIQAATSSPIHVVLKDFVLQGNADVGGATAGGGIVFQGGANDGHGSITGFVIDGVTVMKAKGDGISFLDGVFEGAIYNTRSNQNGRYGFYSALPSAQNGYQPGETTFYSTRAVLNGSDGYAMGGGGFFTFEGATGTANAGYGLACRTTCYVHQFQGETNTLGTLLLGDTSGSANGSQVGALVANLASPSGATATGIYVKNAQGVTISNYIGGATGSQFDIKIDAGNNGTQVNSALNTGGPLLISDATASSRWFSTNYFSLLANGGIYTKPTTTAAFKAEVDNGFIQLKAPANGVDVKNWIIQNAGCFLFRRLSDNEAVFTTQFQICDTGVVASTGLTVGSTGTLLGKLAKYTATISPALVAANTCAEQTFTVTGVAAADVVIAVNKPTAQAGLGISGVRASALNTVAINFCNNTAAGITPTASQSYSFAVLQ